jgi:hypothetical protein
MAVALALLSGACTGTDEGDSGGGGADDLAILAFTTSSAPVHPGESAVLEPVFRGGAGRIEPGVGPVESGVSYAVGPLPATRTFTLIVTSATEPSRELRRELVLPLVYHHRLAAWPDSPTARTAHAGVVVGDGRVLVLGGSSSGGTGWNTADLVDPANGSHEPTGDLWTARTNAVAVALPDGGALVVGGDTDVNERRSVERWSPSTGAFTRLADLLEKRVGHTATMLATGEVLVAGSDAFLGHPAGTHLGAELYDPATGESRAPAGNDMVEARYGHTATRLPDGRVLVVGGWDAYSGVVAVSAEVYDPATETFALAGTMLAPRGGQSAVLLPHGRILVAGGGDLEPVAAAEVWAPPGTFAPAGTLSTPRFAQQAVLLGSGEVVVLGGTDVEARALASAETWRAGDAAFTSRPDVLGAARRGFVLAPLPDGRVLVHGGEPGNGFPVASVSVYE